MYIICFVIDGPFTSFMSNGIEKMTYVDTLNLSYTLLLLRLFIYYIPSTLSTGLKLYSLTVTQNGSSAT